MASNSAIIAGISEAIFGIRHSPQLPSASFHCSIIHSPYIRWGWEGYELLPCGRQEIYRNCPSKRDAPFACSMRIILKMASSPECDPARADAKNRQLAGNFDRNPADMVKGKGTAWHAEIMVAWSFRSFREHLLAFLRLGLCWPSAETHASFIARRLKRPHQKLGNADNPSQGEDIAGELIAINWRSV